MCIFPGLIEHWNCSMQDGTVSHAITTESCKTPLQLFTSGIIAQGIKHSREDLCTHNSSLPSVSGVIVPEVNCPLCNEKESQVRILIDPLQNSSNYRIDIYDLVKTYVFTNL